jgi:twitching motility two-component system response regulator PilH
MTITALVIDDNRTAADILCHFLSLLEIKTNAAYGPRPAMIAINEQKPDIIFLDLNMPGWTGFEVLAYLRRDPETANIPVVVVTSDDQPETETRAMQEGALAVLIKPITIENLEEILNSNKLLGE